MLHSFPESHRSNRIGWLRAAVLGANDGIVSTASLVVGVASSNAGNHAVLVAGVAGLVAGAMSMAAGEYVSVSSQADTERADLELEKEELRTDSVHELEELTHIYISRGLDRDLARQVAVKMTEHDALGAHARDELGITHMTVARPVQAALVSALTFSTGAAMPLLPLVFAPAARLVPWVAGVSLVCLIILGALASKAGGAPVFKGVLRVTFWGALAMAITAGAGLMFGAAG